MRALAADRDKPTFAHGLYASVLLAHQIPHPGKRDTLAFNLMAILSFKCTETERLFTSGKTRRFAGIQRVAERKLAQLDAAATLEFLRSPPGNRLEALDGDRNGQHSIRINAQWRLCFVWTDKGAANVEIVDYH